MFPGNSERITKELTALAPSAMKIKGVLRFGMESQCRKFPQPVRVSEGPRARQFSLSEVTARVYLRRRGALPESRGRVRCDPCRGSRFMRHCGIAPLWGLTASYESVSGESSRFDFDMLCKVRGFRVHMFIMWLNSKSVVVTGQLDHCGELQVTQVPCKLLLSSSPSQGLVTLVTCRQGGEVGSCSCL